MIIDFAQALQQRRTASQRRDDLSGEPNRERSPSQVPGRREPLDPRSREYQAILVEIHARAAKLGW